MTSIASLITGKSLLQFCRKSIMVWRMLSVSEDLVEERMSVRHSSRGVENRVKDRSSHCCLVSVCVTQSDIKSLWCEGIIYTSEEPCMQALRRLQLA